LQIAGVDMATVKAHYQDVLSGFYSWMLGGFGLQLTKNRNFFKNHHIRPKGSNIAIDLGAGCGFQSIPLAELGYTVTAIDLDENLLHELKANDTTGTVTIECDNMINFDSYVTSPPELIVCMTDTLLHLESKDMVKYLFNKVIDHLESSGRLVITFRDLTNSLEDLDRFMPVKQDKSTIFTCFLEYEADTVKVYDLVYSNTKGQWKFNKSFYRKLRLSPDWVKDRLIQAGFPEVAVDIENGLVTMVAEKSSV
jgi:hypothetical protein